MKDKYTIQRTWGQWLDNLALTNGWSDEFKGRVREAMAPEIDWVIRNPNFQNDIVIRKAKVADLLDKNDGDISSFDVYWQWRLDLWNWMTA